MRRFLQIACVLLFVALLALLAAGIHLARRFNASFIETESGAFVRVRGGKGFVIVAPAFLEAQLGPNWAKERLYGACTYFRSPRAASIDSGPLYRVAASPQGAILAVPREDAAPATFLLYLDGPKTLCAIEVDMVKPSIVARDCRVVERLDPKLMPLELRDEAK